MSSVVRKLASRSAPRVETRGPISDRGAPCLDVELTPEVRVRGWAFEEIGTPSWPVAAHPRVEVAWVEMGSLSYRVGAREYVVAAGGSVVIPANVEHQSRVSPGTRATSLWLDVDLIAQVHEAMGPRLARRLMPGLVDSPERIVRLGRVLMDEARLREPGDLLAAGAISEALAVEVVRRAAAERPSCVARDSRIRAAIEQVETCYGDALSVADLARTAGMSRFHFSRLFREQTGRSPYRFLTETRIAKAALLLATGRFSVTEAAISVGFTDFGRFGRFFRRQLGVTPSEVVRRATRHPVRRARITHLTA